jgi:hypothetical protein
LGEAPVLFSTELIQKQTVTEIVKCNDITSRYGLVLTEKQAIELTRTRSHALQENGRVEFSGGVVDKIIIRFCDSPYLSMGDYEETLHELIEIFYYCKNETLDLISDDDLIRYMKKAFDGSCHGSLDLLLGRELYNLSRNLRFGYPPSFSYDIDLPGTEEDEDGEY